MIGSILIFFLVLSVLVLVHEFGHYFVAKKSGVWVEEFGLGLPPRAWGKKIGDTLYSLNWLPFGGFVKLHGEDSSETGHLHKEVAFSHKSKRARAMIVTAGVVMNFLLAVVLFAVGYTFSGFPRETTNVKVVEVAKDSPASNAALQVGDIVRTVNGEPATSNDGFVALVEKHKGEDVDFGIERDGQMMDIHATPRKDHPSNEGSLGVVISATETYFPPIWQRPFMGIYYGFKDAYFWGKIVLQGFGKIFTDLAGGTVPKDIAGPVGIYALTTQAASFGILPLLNFMGILSVNLAILNIMPLPALDGGRLLFILIEGVMGKKVVPKFEALVHTVGMVVLLLLLFAITAYDIRRLIEAGGISNFLDFVAR
jgi:regulator of sigma E protease